jgi:hypothetical protein
MRYYMRATAYATACATTYVHTQSLLHALLHSLPHALLHLCIRNPYCIRYRIRYYMRAYAILRVLLPQASALLLLVLRARIHKKHKKRFVDQVFGCLIEAGVFPPEEPPNHVLINSYTRGQGIAPHQVLRR